MCRCLLQTTLSPCLSVLLPSGFPCGLLSWSLGCWFSWLLVLLVAPDEHLCSVRPLALKGKDPLDKGDESLTGKLLLVSLPFASYVVSLFLCFAVSHPKKLWASGGASIRATSVKLLLASLPVASHVASLFLCLFAGLLVSWLLVLLVAGSLGRPR